MKVVCKNIVCKGRAFSVNQRQAQELERVVCPHCGHQGAMPKGETVTGEDVINQVIRWQDQVLYKKVFKHINTKKMPGTMAKQNEKKPRPRSRLAQPMEKQPRHEPVGKKKQFRIKPKRR